MRISDLKKSDIRIPTPEIASLHQLAHPHQPHSPLRPSPAAPSPARTASPDTGDRSRPRRPPGGARRTSSSSWARIASSDATSSRNTRRDAARTDASSAVFSATVASVVRLSRKKRPRRESTRATARMTRGVGRRRRAHVVVDADRARHGRRGPPRPAARSRRPTASAARARARGALSDSPPAPSEGAAAPPCRRARAPRPRPRSSAGPAGRPPRRADLPARDALGGGELVAEVVDHDRDARRPARPVRASSRRCPPPDAGTATARAASRVGAARAGRDGAMGPAMVSGERVFRYSATARTRERRAKKTVAGEVRRPRRLKGQRSLGGPARRGVGRADDLETALEDQVAVARLPRKDQNALVGCEPLACRGPDRTARRSGRPS